MARSNQEFSDLVVRHLLDIHGGTCKLTPETAIELYQDDPGLREVLSGLAYLHEDLVFREKQRSDSATALQKQNSELQTSRARLAALAAELSTPIIKVWTNVLLIPVVGSFDTTRAIDMMDRLLSAVVHDKARFVVLDLTGVAQVDTNTADHFLRIIGAVKLLGAEGIIAGVQPSVALSMVSLGVDVSGIRTTRDAQEALRYCMRASEASAGRAPRRSSLPSPTRPRLRQ